MSSVIVEIKNLKRSFRIGDETVKALNDVSFTINAGEFITIMGSSGSGKTTLLNILGCLDIPTEGEYFLDGTNVSHIKSQHFDFVVVVVNSRYVNRCCHYLFPKNYRISRTAATIAFSSGNCALSRLRAEAMGTGAVPRRATLPR